MNVLTVGEFKKLLSEYPDDMKMYLSSDEEGNNYGYASGEMGLEICKDDNVVILYPCGNYEFDEIAPIEYSKDEE